MPNPSTLAWLSDPTRGLIPRVRQSQISMAGIVDDTLTEGGISMIEAGTGTGKSAAYLTPVLCGEGRVVVSTAKKALQRQIVEKDLPHMVRVMGLEHTEEKPLFASLKGKGNYACALRVDDFLADTAGNFHPADVNAFESWWLDTPQGDLSELPRRPNFLHLVRTQECVGRRCDEFKDCRYVGAKALAMKARILVVNHALLAHDLALGGGKVLGEYSALIIDEAHQAPGFFRDALSPRLSSRAVEALVRAARTTTIRVPERLPDLAKVLLDALPSEGPIDATSAPAVGRAIGRLAEALAEVKAQLMTLGLWSLEEGSEGGWQGTIGSRELAEARVVATLTKRLIECCSHALSPDVDGPVPYLAYVEGRGQYRELVVTPIEVGPLIAPAIRARGKVIFTSATLATGGDKPFLHACREVGLKTDELKAAVVLPTPFDYAARSMLLLPKGVAIYEARNRESFWSTASDAAGRLLRASKGGAFVLSASTEDAEQFARRLAQEDEKDYELRVQDGDPEELLRWFKGANNRVVVGLKSFWEGMDVPGIGLRLVIIPRLPFPPPSDAVLSARKSLFVAARVREGGDPDRAGLDAWMRFDLALAELDMKQGAGRLIRREDDFGVVAVLDARMGKTSDGKRDAKGYSSRLRRSLPHPDVYDEGDAIALLEVLAKKATRA